MVKKIFFIEGKNNEKRTAHLLALSFVFVAIMSGTILLPFQSLNAQSVTMQMGNDTTANQAQDNATAQVASNITTEDEVNVNVLEAIAQPGFANVYQKLTDNQGNVIPISYNVVGGTAFGMIGDPSRHAMYVLVNPGIDGGALEIDLPRNVLDSKASDGSDSRFVVQIDGRQISGEPTGICIGECANIFDSFKETQTTETDRVLTVLFSPQDRVIEIVGNEGVLF
ncbi:MAG: hypothetical protein ACJ70P_05225 [Nitrososphaera sp.]